MAASAAFAVDGRGCVATPFHGAALPFSSSASTLTVQVGGAVNTQTIGVSARYGRLGSTPGSLSTSAPLGGIPVDTTNDQFSGTVNVARSTWRDDDVVGFEFTEQLPPGKYQVLEGRGAGAGNYKTKHNLIGVADQPASGVFPEGKIDGSTATPSVPFARQSANTFLTRKGALPAGRTYGPTPSRLENFFKSADNLIAIAAYKNEGDLGFGRLMLCATPLGTGPLWRFLCAVSNYNTAEEAANGGTPIATVVMEDDSDTSLYYGAYNGAGSQVAQLALDGGGDKKLPHLCLNCHGGTAENLGSTSMIVKGSTFLPFDLNALSLPSNAGDQSAMFRVLNQFVFLRENSKSASKQNLVLMELLLKWYEHTGGLFSDTGTFDGSAYPAGWSSNPALYTTVVAPYCRGCHVSFAGNLAFPTEKAFLDLKPTIQKAVCERTSTVMPHAQRTYHKFWASGARAALAVDLGIQSCAFKSF